MFKDRQEAGHLLAQKIAQENFITHPQDTVVLGITRGGVILAREIADKFGTKLDMIIVKKLSAPSNSELAIGAIGETKGSQFLNKKMLKELAVSDDYLKKEISRKLDEIKKREDSYRQGKKAIPLKAKDVLIVDDGTATGATMVAACREVWNHEPRRVMVALPVAPLDTYELLEKEADSMVVLETPEPFFAVGQFYKNFPQLTDKEVIDFLESEKPK